MKRRRSRSIRKIQYIPRPPGSRRRMRNPSSKTMLFVGGGVVAAFLVYRAMKTKAVAAPAAQQAVLNLPFGIKVNLPVPTAGSLSGLSGLGSLG